MIEFWQQWLGVSITYVILATLLSLVISNSKIPVIIRIIIIPIVLWWSLALFYGNLGLRGHPIDGYPPPGSIVAGVEIVEGSLNEPGGIYLIVFLPNKSRWEAKRHFLDPRIMFVIFKEGEPVYYKLKYTRSKHKEIEKKLKQARKFGGRLRMKKKKKGDGKWKEKGLDTFEILNPREILRKPEYEKKH